MKRYCGRDFSDQELIAIRQLIKDHPHATRAELSCLSCQSLGWRKPDGGLKAMSCRVAMLRMMEDDLITLPPPRRRPTLSPITFTAQTDPQTPIVAPVHALPPLQICPVARKEPRGCGTNTSTATITSVINAARGTTTVSCYQWATNSRSARFLVRRLGKPRRVTNGSAGRIHNGRADYPWSSTTPAFSSCPGSTQKI